MRSYDRPPASPSGAIFIIIILYLIKILILTSKENKINQPNSSVGISMNGTGNNSGSANVAVTRQVYVQRSNSNNKQKTTKKSTEKTLASLRKKKTAQALYIKTVNQVQTASKSILMLSVRCKLFFEEHRKKQLALLTNEWQQCRARVISPVKHRRIAGTELHSAWHTLEVDGLAPTFEGE